MGSRRATTPVSTPRPPRPCSRGLGWQRPPVPSKPPAITGGARTAGPPIPRRAGLAAFGFAHGMLPLTEAGTQHRASLHVVRGEGALAAHDPGGLDVFGATPEQFHAALTRESHTLKRALTDPRLLDGIGNAYSDEILHAARLSPLRLTSQITPEESERLFRATRETLASWMERLRAATGDGFPENVTAFRNGMAVHGRFRQPCPVCGSPVQRIRSEEHTSELQSQSNLVCRLLLEKKKGRDVDTIVRTVKH